MVYGGGALSRRITSEPDNAASGWFHSGMGLAARLFGKGSGHLICIKGKTTGRQDPAITDALVPVSAAFRGWSHRSIQGSVWCAGPYEGMDPDAGHGPLRRRHYQPRLEARQPRPVLGSDDRVRRGRPDHLDALPTTAGGGLRRRQAAYQWPAITQVGPIPPLPDYL
jgi:hypothetical protein